MPYDPRVVQPMREEMVRMGVQELKTVAEVDAAFGDQRGTTLVFVNSVCGCAAGSARPGLSLALQHGNRPQRVVTVFAGVDLEATARARQYFSDYARALLPSPCSAMARWSISSTAIRSRVVARRISPRIWWPPSTSSAPPALFDVSGHVFHPGHSELHGITVVLETTGDVIYVGRYHEETDRGVLLHDVAEHRSRTVGCPGKSSWRAPSSSGCGPSTDTDRASGRGRANLEAGGMVGRQRAQSMQQALGPEPEGFFVSGPDLFAVVVDQRDRVYRTGPRRIQDTLVPGALRINHHTEILVIKPEHLGRHGHALGVALAEFPVDDDFGRAWVGSEKAVRLDSVRNNREQAVDRPEPAETAVDRLA